MKKKLIWLGSVIAGVSAASAVFAAEAQAPAGAAAAEGVKAVVSIPFFVGTSVAIALGFSFTAALCGIGQGLAIRGGLEGIARQPEASDKIQIAMLLGLAFIESLTLFALFIDIVLLFANPFIKFLQ